MVWLPENDKNGKAIKYLVKEVNAQGEDTTPEGYEENGLVVTNTEKPIETTSISGEKVWDDKDNQDGKRPEKVSVNLLANGEKVKTDVTSETNWKYEFKNLPKYDEGKENRIYSDRRSRRLHNRHQRYDNNEQVYTRRDIGNSNKKLG